jgi:hypothetical protein
MPIQCRWLDVGGSLLNVVMAMKLSDRLATGAKPVQVRYALASEAGFDDGQAPVSARVGGGYGVSALGVDGSGVGESGVSEFDVDAALPHLLVDMVPAEAPRAPRAPQFVGVLNVSSW